METVRPADNSDRLMWIDAARGFAILGIFIVNIGAFSAPYFLYGGEDAAWTRTIDQSIQVLIDMLFQASFYTLFSLLFGFGLQMLKERLQERDMAVNSFLFRRLVILIGFGLVHAFLIWHGDILLSYGVIGLIFMVFIHRSAKTLITWGLLMLGVSVYWYSTVLFDLRDLLGNDNTSAIHSAKRHYQSDDLSVILSQNLSDWIYSNGLLSYILLASTLLPLFLFGMYVARKRWIHNPDEHRRKLFTGWVISMVLFVILKIGPYLYGNPMWFSYVQDNIGGTASALFYLFSITLIARSRTGRTFLKPLSYVGRMSLSNYIMQSIICFGLFYGIGLGMYGSVRPVEAMGIVALVYTLQIFFSQWWLKRYRYGPIEWVWRSLTYKKRQPLRKRG